MEHDRVTDRNLARMAACIDHARTKAGFTEPGKYGPDSYTHRSGLAVLAVTDSECSFRLAIFGRQPNRYSQDGFTVVETGSIDLSNLEPAMFAAVLDAAVANL